MRKLIAGAAALAALAACAAEQANTPATNAPAGPPSAGASQDNAMEPPATVRERAKTELKQAEIELGQAGSDCSRACKALASMERATDHLCGVVATPDEQRQCDDAREKLKSSKDRVRSTCGECSH